VSKKTELLHLVVKDAAEGKKKALKLLRKLAKNPEQALVIAETYKP
jgi:hypothetical protein